MSTESLTTMARLRAVSLFSVVRRAKRETRKWPRARLMARDGRGTKRTPMCLVNCSASIEYPMIRSTSCKDKTRHDDG